MLIVPRSVRLAAWAGAVLDGRADVAALVTAVTDDTDEPHAVHDLGGDPGRVIGRDLHDLMALLAEDGVGRLRAVLPAPGDPAGLPGPAAFNTAAVEAGEAVVAVSGPGGPHGPTSLAVLPQLEHYGSELEPGTLVTWQVHRVTRRPELDVVDLGEADRALRAALLQTTTLLREIDLARWRPEAAELWADLSGAELDPLALPPGWPARAEQMLATALRLRAIIELALDDDGAAVSTWEADQRRAGLRTLDGVARRAVAAAAGPHPLPR